MMEDQYLTFKKYTLVVIVTLIVSNFIFRGTVGVNYSKKFKAFEKRQIVRDSIIDSYEIAISKLKKEKDSLIVVQEKIDSRLDSTITQMKNYTVITVKDKDIIEALSWIKQTNGLDTVQ